MKIKIQETKEVDVTLPLFRKNETGNIKVKIIDEDKSLWAYLRGEGGELYYASSGSMFLASDFTDITEEEFLAHVDKVVEAVKALAVKTKTESIKENTESL